MAQALTRDELVSGPVHIGEHLLTGDDESEPDEQEVSNRLAR